MNNEIKEILEELESLFEVSEAPEHIIKDFDKIKDYITNLQEKYNDLLEVHKIENNDIQELLERKEKAINRISLMRMDDITIETHKALNEILNILKGSDEE